MTVTITFNFPEGTDARVTTVGAPSDGPSESATVPTAIANAIEERVPRRYRQWVQQYLRRCVEELRCTAEFPAGRTDYVNLFPPAPYRRKRVAAVTYSSSRTAIFAGPVDLGGFDLARETLNSGRYVNPKLPHLDSTEAVDEAIVLTRLVIEDRER